MTEITRIKIPHFESNELNPKVLKLFEIIQQQGEAIQQMRDEIAVEGSSLAMCKVVSRMRIA